MTWSTAIRLTRFWVIMFVSSGATESLAAGYDPLQVDQNFVPDSAELTVHDTTRNRDLPIRVYLPADTKPQPVVCFSHGLGGTRNGNSYCGNHWAARNYVAVFVQHPGSDDSVWRNKPADQRMEAIRGAASLENFKERTGDISAVLDALTKWNSDPNSRLKGRLDLKEIGMSGHSFGAITTQAVSGEKFPVAGTRFTDSRIKAAIMMSPSSPHHGSSEDAFGSITIPWLLMTGTKDTAPIGQTDLKSRLAVYPALHGGPKYELVLNNAEHSAFTDRALPGDHEPRNPNHHRVILALSTAFWDAYLRNDKDALAWLNGSGPRSVLESTDRWQLSAR